MIWIPSLYLLVVHHFNTSGNLNWLISVTDIARKNKMMKKGWSETRTKTKMWSIIQSYITSKWSGNNLLIIRKESILGTTLCPNLSLNNCLALGTQRNLQWFQFTHKNPYQWNNQFTTKVNYLYYKTKGIAMLKHFIFEWWLSSLFVPSLQERKSSGFSPQWTPAMCS